MKVMRTSVNLLAFLLLLVLATTEAEAQRLIPRQTGLALSVGTPALDAEQGIFEEGAYQVNLEFSQYLKRYNYYVVGLSQTQQHYKYKDYSVPVQNYLLHIGYMHPLVSDYTKTFVLYGGIAGVGGYQHINLKEGVFPNGARLVDRSRFVGGGEARGTIELFVTNSLVLQFLGKATFLWGTDLNLFYPSLSAGLKYNF